MEEKIKDLFKQIFFDLDLTNEQAKMLNKKEQELLKEAEKQALTIPVVSKRLSIKLEDWHYQCGDGCCDMYGTEIALNKKVCDNQYAGDDVQKSLEFVLTELGYEVDIDVC